jgi:hypothetical protein
MAVEDVTITAERVVPEGAPVLDAAGTLTGVDGGWVSPDRAVRPNDVGAELELTSPSGDWDALAGQGLFSWAVAYRDPRGPADPGTGEKPWRVLVGQFAPYSALAFGARDRTGGLPRMKVANADLKGVRVRFLMWRSAGAPAVRCGVVGHFLEEGDDAALGGG